MLKEFKEFALKGNVIDLAIGVIIGGAFGKIVTSLVEDILMPIFGLLTSGVNFENMVYNVGLVTIAYGSFIQTIVDFLIVAISIFIAIKLINKARKKGAAEEAADNSAESQGEQPSQTEALLTEIRDLLKSKQN